MEVDNLDRQRTFISRQYSFDSKDIPRWCGEDEELVCQFIDNNYNLPVDYKLINAFLLLLVTKDDTQWIETVDVLLEKFDEFSKNINNKEISANLERYSSIEEVELLVIDSIIRLYKSINRQLLNGFTFKILGEYLENKPVILYHGVEKLNFGMIPNLEQLRLGETYISPLFLATSVLDKIAYNYGSTYKRVMEIIIEPKDFDKVPYTYLGGNIQDINKQEYTESEILLNLFTKLEFLGKYTKIINYSKQTGKVKIEGTNIVPILETVSESYIIYKFKWLENPLYTPTELDYILMGEERKSGGKKVKKAKKSKIKKAKNSKSIKKKSNPRIKKTKRNTRKFR